MKHASNTIQSGYKIIRDSLPVISIARESLETVSPHLPNVSMVIFVKHVLRNLTPELMRTDYGEQ